MKNRIRLLARSMIVLSLSVMPGLAQSVYTPYTFTTLAGLAQVDQFGRPLGGSADGTGSVARFSFPSGVAVDSTGNVYVADSRNDTIRQVTPGGVVTTLAGWAGTGGSADGTGSAAGFALPSGVAVDSAGNLYVADEWNHTIRKVTPAGVVTTIAGLAGISGSVDGTQTGARFDHPSGVAVDSAGNLYVADAANATIRKVTPAGAVTTLAGLAGSSGSVDGVASAARFGDPSGVAVDGAGNVYVADTGNDTIRKVTPAGVVTTLAGLAHSPGSTDGIGSAARFDSPFGVALDTAGNVYVTDSANDTIRKVTPAGAVTTLAGLAGSSGSTDGTGSAARFYGPHGVAVDSAGNVYVAETANNTIRKGSPPLLVASTDGGGTVTVDPPGPYLTNTVATVTETNWPGWTFLGWTGDATGTSPALQFTLTNHLQVTAAFGAPVTVTVTHATLQRSPDLALYPYGSQVQLSLQPDLGYQFQSWSDGNTNLVRTLTVTNFVSLQASLSAIPSYTVSATALGGTGGSVQLSPSQGQYFQGTTVVLTAVPNPGYDFQTWLDNVQVNPRPVVVTSNVTLFAVFAPQTGPATIVTVPTDTNVVVGGAVLFSVA
ncbi:MAG: InlB B-repeat-containing protein, partial [Limisphaerales bacterium]